MARRAPHRIVRTARRDTVWFEFPPQLTVLGSASLAAVTGSLNAAALALRPFTIVRTRGTLQVQSDQAAAEDYGCGFGICVVSDQASAIGVTAVPTPVTDYGSDLWFLIEQMFGRMGGASVEQIGFERQIDSKAMRKVDVGQDINIVFETPSFCNSARLYEAFRMLVKLH